MKRNKILSAVLVIVMLFSILTASTIFGSSDIVHPGDVNRDGDVCVKDIFDLQRYLAGDEGAITVPTTTIITEPLPPITAEDFELTISVDEEVWIQGKPFIVYAELKNNSGRDVEIAYGDLIVPRIPEVCWIFDGGVPWPWPFVEPFESGSTISRRINLLHWYGELSQGVYQLTVYMAFFSDWEQSPPILESGHISWDIISSAQQIDVRSNTVEFLAH